MRDVAAQLGRWIEEGREVAVATVVGVSGSAPRGPGAALAVDGAGAALGSVSGGCVEGAVYELCTQALADGRPVVQRFGYSDDDAFAVGLTCGGTVEVLVTPVGAAAPARPVLAAALAAFAEGASAALVRVVRGPDELLGGALLVHADDAYEGTLGGSPQWDRIARNEALDMLALGRTGTVDVALDGALCPGGVTLFVECRVPPPRMIVFGAVDFAEALVRAGSFLGFHVTVCDARPVFATRERFPEADEVVVDWPHRYLRQTRTDARTVLCVLTHDAKFDVPLLTEALRMPLAYVGAMGSRRTHADRLRRLREVGLTERELARLRSPIGLDLGGRTPQETALSIAAEIVATRHGGSGLPLTGSSVPLHREGDAPDGKSTEPSARVRRPAPMHSHRMTGRR
ncbi:XdhC family protein [Streptomyces sp. NPDC087440]|uniref:XdhC family protein n=1 Tax=Streptomyces sp. NPDC087440 TaxID=3365790 RepID=UPI003825BC54